MAQCVKVLAAQSDDPSSIPWIYTVEGENQLLQAGFEPPHAHDIRAPHN